MEFPFYIYNVLAKKGEIKMKSMNLFEGSKPKENTNQLPPPAPIQNEDGVLTFAINGIIYSFYG